jgi:hypothetical protein
VLRTDCAGIDAIALSSLGHGIVAGVEVFSVFEVLREVIGSRREFAV